MAISRFHMDNFRPYDISYDKTSSLHNPSRVVRYPTPTSIADSPLSSKPARLLTSRSSTRVPVHTYTHPLPTRPPAKVWAHSPSRPHSPRQPTELHSPPAYLDNNTLLHWTTSTSIADLSDPESQPLSDHLHGASDPAHRSSLTLEGAGASVAPHPIADDGNMTHLPLVEEILPIDPAIIDAEATHDNIPFEGPRAVQKITADGQDSARSSPDPLLSEFVALHGGYTTTSDPEPAPEVATLQSTESRFDNRDASRQTHHPFSQTAGPTAMTEGIHNRSRGSGEISSEKRQHQLGQDSGRTMKRSRTNSPRDDSANSLLTLRSCFLTTSIEGRLEFLSWLFEGALAQGVSDLAVDVDPLSATRKTGNEEPRHKRARRPSVATVSNGSQFPAESRKGKQWKPEEVSLLVQLKQQKLTWAEVTKRFAEPFPLG